MNEFAFFMVDNMNMDRENFFSKRLLLFIVFSLGSLDKNLQNTPKKLFTSIKTTDNGTKQKWDLVLLKLKNVLAKLRQNKVHEGPAPTVAKIYVALVYKYGQAYRHHDFFRSAKQVHSYQKRLGKGELATFLEKLSKVRMLLLLLMF